MKRNEQARQGKKGRKNGRRVEFGSDTRHLMLMEWLLGAVDDDIASKDVVSDNVRALLLPPSRDAKGIGQCMHTAII